MTSTTNLYVINDAKQEQQIIDAAKDVFKKVLFGGAYSNIPGFIFSQQNSPGDRNSSVDDLVKHCGRYRSCVEDAVYASMLLCNEYGELSKIFHKIISFVVTRNGKANTYHAALMLKWKSQRGQTNAIVLDAEPARRLLVHDPEERWAVDTVDCNSPPYPDRTFTFFEKDHNLRLKVSGVPPIGTFEEIENKDLFIPEVSQPVWNGLKHTLDGHKPTKGGKARPFVVNIRVRRWGELTKGVPGVSLIAADKKKYSISSPVRFIMNYKQITMQFHTPPPSSHSVTESWKKHTFKAPSSLDGLKGIRSFIRSHSHWVRNYLGEAGIGIRDITDQLESVIELKPSEIPATTTYTLDEPDD